MRINRNLPGQEFFDCERIALACLFEGEQTAANRSDTKLLVDGLSEPIGMSLDVPKNKLYFTELNGGVSEAALDGTGLKKNILSSGSASGVALVYIPK